ncbi:MAG: hypothetical protein M5U16_17095 [Hyphomicrobium sp.]|nr:hypothetical protein [Hyphomicrobium sp.]
MSCPCRRLPASRSLPSRSAARRSSRRPPAPTEAPWPRRRSPEGIAGFAIGTAFPFNANYAFSPTGYWYVNDPAHYRYPTAYYRWYPPAGGYIYVGPNWRYWYRNRNVVYAPTPYFVTPPRGYVYYPPIPYGYRHDYAPVGGYK